MELRQFIRDAMMEIAMGIQQAKVDTKDLWAVTPAKLNGESVLEKSFIEFDIAVTVQEGASSQKDGKGGVKAEISVLGAKLGADGSGGVARTETNSTQNVSRITFKVPVYMNAHFRGDPNIAIEADFLRSLNPEVSI
jgi:hypothetical protein